jgi:hypothetical protein
VRFDALARSVSRSTPVRADSVAVTQGCRGGLDPSACSAPAATSRLGRGHRCFPAYQPRSCAHLLHRSVYNQSKNVLDCSVNTERSVCVAPSGDSTWQPAPNDAEAGPLALRPLLRVAGIGPEPESAKDAWNRIELFFATRLN